MMADEIIEKHILKSGDILFAASGNKNVALVYKDLYTRSEASTSFLLSVYMTA